jgi:iron complex transport system substrate-binding protein
MKISNLRWATGLCFACLALLTACGEAGSDPAFVKIEEAKSLEIKYSTGLRISEIGDGYRVEVRNPQDSTELLATYHFSRKEGSNNAEQSVLHIPTASVALNSTTFVPYFDKMNALENIAAVSYTSRVSNPKLQEKIKAGEVLEIAGSDGVDMERLLKSEPDALMAYVFGESSFEHIKAQDIPVILNMEYLETNPLGRAEWVKLIGCMLDRYDEADALFNDIVMYYNEVRNLANTATSSPVVFSGSKYEKVWFTPGNGSFVAQFIRDAGATYAFEHIDGQGNVELDFESVLSTINVADYWGLIVSSPTEFMLSDLLRLAPEYALFNAFKQGQVFVCNTTKSDYFGEAVLEPQVILADLVAILHPELLPRHQHTYFRPVLVDINS